MEMGSDSVNDSRGSSTESSLAGGLKFGQKVYFEDASFGGGAGNDGGLMATGAFSSSSSTGSGRRGRGSGFGQSSQPPRCQVEGCGVDLSNAKAYYSRHKVCGTHSKTPMVIVGGLEQRFCQQCSRFHRLPEFDQGKRSCRRRLAGHNERRRKPQPGSLLASPYARLSSPIFGTPGVGGSFVMDPMAWPAARSSEHTTGNHMRRSLSTPWQVGSENPQLGIYQQGSMAGGMSLPCPYTPGITSPGAESFKGVAECALSLLSNQQQQQSSPAWWSLPRASSSFNLMDAEGVSLAQPTQGSTHHHQNLLWGFKSNDGSIDSHNVGPVLGLAQISEPAISGTAAGDSGGGGFDLSYHRRRYLQPEDPAYGSSSSQHRK